jgi:hypothetical protein
VKYYFIIICLFSLRLFAYNQTSVDLIKSNNQCQHLDKDSISKNSIYLEALGCGIFGSINYERILYSKKTNSLNCRIGYVMIPMSGKHHIIPFLVNHLTSFHKSFSFEIGLGTRYIYSQNGWENSTYKNSFDIIGNAGFRFLIRKHFLLKLDWTPQFSNNVFIIGIHGNPMAYLGFSLGYSF